MRAGSKTAAGFGSVFLPAALLFVLVTGNVFGLLGGLVGYYLLLKVCNALDNRDIDEGY